ncbi:menaquinol-cytochrome c reductase cytochrome b/c subunit [Chengkuizengella marina]|uniref:C-type cytochrome n=1 Tax=Chengkuizengella marina TaxID=2507566 RepID=A0A6N9Q751_9BACL|nr:menaquinol-cytochrome c reductase cytochrome b/c subunit [Chengkuizengella marina]NBI30493.1 c-type cytochrome [Chengkuizengella marina]
MAHDHNSKEKVVYVGDSRVKKYKKNNVPLDYSAYPGNSEAFVPNFLLKEWMVGSVFLVGFMILTMSHPSPLGYPADPTKTDFVPIPDWYFLFLYQLLKYPYTSDAFVVLGTLVLPGLLFGGLMLAPFLDTGKERRWYKRPIASSLMFLSLFAIVFLTMVSWQGYQHELEELNIIPEHIERAEKLEAGLEVPGGKEEEPVAIVNKESEGYDIYQKSSCISCHAADLNGAVGPTLLGIGDKYSKEEITDIIINGFGNRMGPQLQQNLDAGLTEADLDTLAVWLAEQKAPAGEEAPEEVTDTK